MITNSPQETINLAKTLMLKNWKQLQTHPLLFLLIGNLGAGKTQFAKGIGKFLQINQPITSPNLHSGGKNMALTAIKLASKFLHLDTWRIQNPEELALLNLEKRLLPKTVCVIEWAITHHCLFSTLSPKISRQIDYFIIVNRSLESFQISAG